MVRFVLTCAVCVFAVLGTRAAEPAPEAPPSSTILGRKRIEALLQTPADLDFSNRRNMSVGELLDLLHTRHHLSIRFDIPVIADVYGLSLSGCSEGKLVGTTGGEPLFRSTAVAWQEPDPRQEFLQRLGKIEVSVDRLDGQTITVATALRLVLDAFPNTNSGDPDGMPRAMTDATLLDFLVEDDGILITTRLKALATKETRVYSVKNLRNVDLPELSTLICQSVRPWSWRSRIDELSEQLKSRAPSLKPTTLSESSVEFEVDKKGISLEMSDVKMADPPDKIRQTAMIGNAVSTAITTLAQVSLNSLEVVHYADPPTGTIRVLPGKLIITQSQAAHREIAELLKQLSDE